MIYYVLITATDLTFSIHSVINCMTLILRHVDFFKLKWFCLILQCSGVVSYQVSAMSIIMLVFDLFISIRNPFSTETRKRRKISVLCCIIAIIVASSLAYAPFIWWYGDDRNLEFCSIANLYGANFHNYHIMATSVLAILFLLMILASFLLLREIKKSFQPTRLMSLKLTIPKILQDDSDEAQDDKKFASDVKTSDMAVSEDAGDKPLPDLVSDVEKVTMKLSNYSGIDNKAFNKEERMSLRDKILKTDSITSSTVEKGRFCDTVYSVEETAVISENQVNEYTKAYETISAERDDDYNGASCDQKLPDRGHSSTSDHSQEEGMFDHKKDEDANIDHKTENSDNALPGHVNSAFESDELNSKFRHVPANGTQKEKPDASQADVGKAGEKELDTEQKQRLSVDTEKPYRGSIDKVRRLTGTEAVGPELKEIQAAHVQKRKKFIQACQTVAAFMIAFLGCGLPYYILGVVELSQGTTAEDTHSRRTVRVICALFLYLLPIVDPILYTSRFEVIRTTLYRFLPKCCKCSE